MFLKKWISVCLVASALNAEAREVQGVLVPETLALDNGASLVLQGAGLRRQFLLKVYVAALYVPQLGMEKEALIGGEDTKVLTLQFLRDVDWDDVTEALEEGLEANTPPKVLKRLAPAIQEMNALIKRVGGIQEGGVLRLDLSADAARFQLNDKTLGVILMPGLGKALLKIWVGGHPAQQSLKDALLGGS